MTQDKSYGTDLEDIIRSLSEDSIVILRSGRETIRGTDLAAAERSKRLPTGLQLTRTAV
jgi:hypothetical protein